MPRYVHRTPRGASGRSYLPQEFWPRDGSVSITRCVINPAPTMSGLGHSRPSRASNKSSMCILPRKRKHPRTCIDTLDSPDEQAEPTSSVDASPRLLQIRGAKTPNSRAVSSCSRSSSLPIKNNTSVFRKSVIALCRPASARAFRDRHEREVGCGGRDGACDERFRLRTVKPCGSGAPKQASSSRGRQRVARMTGSTKRWSPGRARSKP